MPLSTEARIGLHRYWREKNLKWAAMFRRGSEPAREYRRKAREQQDKIDAICEAEEVARRRES